MSVLYYLCVNRPAAALRFPVVTENETGIDIDSESNVKFASNCSERPPVQKKRKTSRPRKVSMCKPHPHMFVLFVII